MKTKEMGVRVERNGRLKNRKSHNAGRHPRTFDLHRNLY